MQPVLFCQEHHQHEQQEWRCPNRSRTRCTRWRATGNRICERATSAPNSRKASVAKSAYPTSLAWMISGGRPASSGTAAAVERMRFSSGPLLSSRPSRRAEMNAARRVSSHCRGKPGSRSRERDSRSSAIVQTRERNAEGLPHALRRAEGILLAQPYPLVEIEAEKHGNENKATRAAVAIARSVGSSGVISGPAILQSRSIVCIVCKRHWLPGLDRPNLARVMRPVGTTRRHMQIGNCHPVLRRTRRFSDIFLP